MGIRFGIFKNPICVAVQKNVAPYPHNMRCVCAIYCGLTPSIWSGGHRRIPQGQPKGRRGHFDMMIFEPPDHQ